MQTVGSKAQVYHGTAKHTPGGLTKKDLFKNKHGRIVSRKQSQAGKKAIKRLFALGYKPSKGKFVAMRKSMVDGRRKKKASRRTRKHGGAAGLVGAGGASGGQSSPSLNKLLSM